MVAVDLGLPSGVKWGSLNLGSHFTYKLGDEFHWCETNSQNTVLATEEDAASIELGEEWRMPTQWDFEELLNYCTVEIPEGEKCYLVKSNINQNSIILPVDYTVSGAGYTHRVNWHYYERFTPYWTSCAAGKDKATIFDLFSKEFSSRPHSAKCYIRPVKAGRVPLKEFSFENAPASVPVGSKYGPAFSFVPSNALDKSLVIECSDSQIASLGKDGYIYALYPGEVEIDAVSPSTGQKVSHKLKVDDYVVPEAVDLGLPSGTKWAADDLGAPGKSQNGQYFAWRETRSKLDFSSQQYLPKTGSPFYDKTVPPKDDAATVILGEDWRIPSPDEFEELIQNCEISSVDENGKAIGVRFTSRINGRTLFFPWTGYEVQDMNKRGVFPYYWTSKLVENYSLDTSTTVLIKPNNGQCWEFINRPHYNGLLIRPVCGGNHPVSPFTLKADEVTLYIDETCDLPVEYAPGTTIICRSSNPDVVSVGYNDGKLQARSIGYATISVSDFRDDFYVRFKVTVPGHLGMVPLDLNLPSGKKWASCNVGAQTDGDIGIFLAFGESVTKESYSKDTYIGGSEDPVTTLLGPHWRMPTSDEMYELIHCSGKTFKHISGQLFNFFIDENDSWAWHLLNNNLSFFILPAGGYMDGNQNVEDKHIFYWCKAADGTACFISDPADQYDPTAFNITDPQPSDSPHLGMLVRPIWVE